MKHPFLFLRVCGVCAAFLLLGSSLPGELAAQTAELDLRMDPLEDSIRIHLFSDPAAALGHARAYLERSRSVGDRFYTGKGENFVGMAHYVMGEVHDAIDAYLRSLDHFQAIGDAWYTAVVQNNIGVAHQLRRKPEETIAYYERALAGFRALNDTSWTANLLNNIAIQYLNTGDIQRALETQTEALAIHAARGDEASVHLMQGNLASTLLRRGDTEEAYAMARAFLAHERADDDLAHRVNVMTTLGTAQSAKGLHSEALATLSEAMEIARERNFREQEANAAARLSPVQEALGDHRGALATFRLYHNLYDSLYSREKDERITELLTLYEVSRKDAAIGLLEAENALAARNQWLLGLSSLLLLLVAVGVSLLYRSRNHHIRALEEKNRTIVEMLGEKEYLIREIHHRVKNNLQMISSLLQLQSRSLSEPGAVEALTDGENRVKSMAIIHHHLYSRDDVRSVEVRGYVDNLCENIRASYRPAEMDVTLRQEIADIRLDVSVMVPLGLILNELITNAYKYAFQERKSGEILVRLGEEGGELVVTVQDNGSGFDPGVARRGFGSRMIQAFLRKLDGDMDTRIVEGTQVTIRIREYGTDPLLKRTA